MPDVDKSAEDDTSESDGSGVGEQDEVEQKGMMTVMFALDKERKERFHKIMEYYGHLAISDTFNILIDNETRNIEYKEKGLI